MGFNYEKLDSRIKELGLRKTDISKQLGRPYHYLYDVLKQKNRIPLDIQKQLADILMVSVEWLNDQPEKEKPPVQTDGIRSEILARLFSMTDEQLKELLDMLRAK